MGDLDYWIWSFVGTCELVASQEAMGKLWIEKDHTISSIHDFDELYVQLMDDARLKNIVFEFGELGSNAEIRAVIEGFTNALEALNCEVEHGNVPKSPQEILAMNQWHELQRYARAALELPLFQLYRDGRVDHQVMERLKAKGYVGAKK